MGMPLPGARCNLNQKMNRSTYASQNTGAETPNSAKSIPTRSASDLFLMAETMPMGRPINSQTTPAPTASMIVTGSRPMISVLTGSKLDHEKYTCRLRKNPGYGIRPLANRQYCTHTGLSRPMACSALAIVSGVWARPAALMAGFPGGSLTKIRNVRIDTTHRTKMRKKNLRTR